jgi:hypothetical protein
MRYFRDTIGEKGASFVALNTACTPFSVNHAESCDAARLPSHKPGKISCAFAPNISYLDTFRLIGIFFLIVLPLIFFLRVKKKTPEELAAAMKAASEAH